MDTRSVHTRLDQHEALLAQIQSDIGEIRSAMAKERGEAAEFRKIMLVWMKQR